MNFRKLILIAMVLFTTCCDSVSVNTRDAKAVESSQPAGTGQANTNQDHGAIDLTAITGIVCKGRVLDYNHIPVVNQLIAQGPSCIPFLIDHLDDDTGMKSEAVTCWNRVTVADVALMILTDLFRDSSWEKSTVPEARWYTILEYSRDSGKSAEQALREFVRKHGRAAIKAKWMKIWEENREKIFWDENERCFNIKKI